MPDIHYTDPSIAPLPVSLRRDLNLVGPELSKDPTLIVPDAPTNVVPQEQQLMLNLTAGEEPSETG